MQEISHPDDRGHFVGILLTLSPRHLNSLSLTYTVTCHTSHAHPSPHPDDAARKAGNKAYASTGLRKNHATKDWDDNSSALSDDGEDAKDDGEGGGRTTRGKSNILSLEELKILGMIGAGDLENGIPMQTLAPGAGNEREHRFQ